MKCEQCGTEMIDKGLQKMSGSEEIRRVWECTKCKNIYYQAP